MDAEILGVMIPIIAIIGVFTMIVYLRKYENQERMAMIDKGVDPQFFNVKKQRNNSLPLRISLLLIGGGVGLLLGYFLDRAFYMEEVAYFSMLFIFGGLGLGASYLIEEKKMKEESREAKS
jgi:F0F1-type ATP synthase assembly protein I